MIDRWTLQLAYTPCISSAFLRPARAALLHDAGACVQGTMILSLSSSCFFLLLNSHSDHDNNARFYSLPTHTGHTQSGLALGRSSRIDFKPHHQQTRRDLSGTRSKIREAKGVLRLIVQDNAYCCPHVQASRAWLCRITFAS